MTFWLVGDEKAFDSSWVMAGNAAIGLLVRAASWCCQQNTGGRVPAEMAGLLGTRREIEALIRAELWARDDDGSYRFTPWTGPTQASVEATRAAATERKRRSRKARSHVDVTRDSDVTDQDVTRDVTPHVTRDGPVTFGQDLPQNQDQEPPQTSSGAPHRPTPTPTPTPRGCRIPDVFEPTDEMLDWARREAPHAGRRDHDAFIDYWRGKSGASARKVDWPATWRNWMRKTSDERQTGRRSTTDERVAQAQSLLAWAESLDEADRLATDQRQLATVTQLAIGDTS